jgi:SNF2 family DNA or RNA helicase
VATWQIDEAKSVLCDGRVAALDEVFEALSIDDGSVIRAELAGLSFSRRALVPRLLTEGGFPDKLQLRLVVQCGQTWVDVDTRQSSIVYSGTWSPIHTSTMGAISNVMTLHSIAPGVIDAGKYLWLSTKLDVLPLLEDNVKQEEGRLWNARTVQLEPPPGLNATLFPYQKAGSSFARILARLGIGSLIADEMGLGKTIQAISVLVDLPPGSSTLVVCPLSLLENWRRELALFAPQLRVSIHHGYDRAGIPRGFDGFDVVISPYGTVVSDMGLMSNCKWDVVVLDEAQSIKNPDSSRSQSIKRLDRRVSIALTGTPVENSLQDLFSIAEFVMPSLLGARNEFESLFPDQLSAATRLGTIVSPLTMRRRIAEVATDLPELVERDYSFALSEIDHEEYVQQEALKPGLSGIQNLRVLCAHADARDANQITNLQRQPKVEFLLSKLNELFENGEKALVFASFSETLDRLAYLASLSHFDPFIAIVDGRSSTAERQAYVDSLSAFSGPGCLFLNPAAAGVGLNITSANHVFHFNPEWNPQVTRQATARSFRRGQSRPVFAWRLYYTGTIEEHAVGVAESKIDLADGFDEGLQGRGEHDV